MARHQSIFRPRAANTPVRSGILQRTYLGGRHTPADGGCEAYSLNRMGVPPTTGSDSQAPPILHDVMHSLGQPLDPAVRSFMEPRFGRDFSHIGLSAKAVQPMQSGLTIGSANDVAEQEADRVAERVVSLPEGPSRKARAGYDFSGVRIHTGDAASRSARAVEATAYTLGRDIVFGAGAYSPDTHSGRRLLAHELTHTVQQAGESVIGQHMPDAPDVHHLGDDSERDTARTAARRVDGGRSHMDYGMDLPIQQVGGSTTRTLSSGTVQRQASGTNVAITARTVFPYPEKSRLLVNRLLSDEMVDTAARYAEGDADQVLAVRVLRAADKQVATVTTATDDLFEAVITSVKVSAEGNDPGQVVNDVALRFRRQPDAKFTFELRAGAKILFDQNNLAAKKSGGEVELSPPKGPSVTVRPGGASGQLEIVGELGPMEIEALQLTRLSDVPAASNEDNKIVEQINQKAAATRRERRQEVTLGAGAQLGTKLDPVLAASWRISFNAPAKTGGVLQIPLHVDVEYAPPRSVLAAVSTGVEIALPTQFPVNVRVVGGVAAGAAEGSAPGGGKPPLLPAFGPTVGVGAGIGGKTFRVELDAQHLQNVARSSPNVDTVTLSAGIKF